jgi:hypothetical protein
MIHKLNFVSVSLPLLILFFFCLSSCGSDENSGPQKSEIKGDNTNRTSPVNKQLSINILWDLSDRIDTTKNPASPQFYQRDVEIIKTFTELFRKDMDQKGAYNAKGKIRVFFTPLPSNNDINVIAQNLSIDLSKYSGQGSTKQKKEIYDNITPSFVNNAYQIYRLTEITNKGNKDWDGSDIWRFFKNDVDQCIESDTNYRNILVLLTDGYIYHRDSKERVGNKTAYILPETLKPFRGNNDWKQLFEKGQYGLISTRKDLQNLEVLVLEINPSQDYKDDEDYIKIYLKKWFENMGVKKSEVYNTDLPEYTKKRIESFLNNGN